MVNAVHHQGRRPCGARPPSNAAPGSLLEILVVCVEGGMSGWCTSIVREKCQEASAKRVHNNDECIHFHPIHSHPIHPVTHTLPSIQSPTPSQPSIHPPTNPSPSTHPPHPTNPPHTHTLTPRAVAHRLTARTPEQPAHLPLPLPLPARRTPHRPRRCRAPIPAEATAAGSALGGGLLLLLLLPPPLLRNHHRRRSGRGGGGGGGGGGR
jgi:hypothetical protein